jgi:hypothetical protein
MLHSIPRTAATSNPVVSVSDEAARAGEDVEESTAKDAVRIEHATPASTIKPPGAIMPKALLYDVITPARPPALGPSCER